MRQGQSTHHHSAPDSGSRPRAVRRLLAPAVLALGCLAVLAACADRPPAVGEEIVVGVIAPLSSTVLRSGPPTVEGAVSAAKEILLVPVYPSLLPSLMRQAREMGLTAPALGGDTWGTLAAAERRGWGASPAPSATMEPATRCAAW